MFLVNSVVGVILTCLRLGGRYRFGWLVAGLLVVCQCFGFCVCLLGWLAFVGACWCLC